MSRLVFLLLTLFLVIPGAAHAASSTESVAAPVDLEIIAPTPGQVLQGLVPIQINLPEQVISAELSFGYEGDPRDTWFLIAEFNNFDERTLQTDWDTTTLTDDNYRLRVVARTANETLTASVSGLRVRNYTPIETNTPMPTSTAAPQETISPVNTRTETPSPVLATITPLPPNPAQLSIQEITTSAGKGIGVTLLIFLLIGTYRVFHQIRSRR